MPLLRTTFIWALLFSAVSSFSFAQTYAPLSGEITEGVNVVIRKWNESFQVINPSRATHQYDVSITILNHHADKYAQLMIPYDDLTKVDYIRAKVYNAYGQEIRTLRRKDIEDYSNFSSISVLEDNRIKVANLTHNQYPYTIEYSYQLITTNMMLFPVWDPLPYEKVATQQSSFTVTVPHGYNLRHQTANLPAPSITEGASSDTYHWSANELKSPSHEPLIEDYKDLYPMVITAPSEFAVEGYQGSMNSWKEYGNFFAQLNAGRNDLASARKAEFAAIANQYNSVEEKVQALYEHLQANTRYVSIQLGLGGWQPFKSAFVDEQGYGDCKALSFYMMSMLDAAGIPSYYTLIRAGRDNIGGTIDESFSRNAFNHAILGVPNGQDTLWLECTSQTSPFNHPGTFTGNREALMITDQGGQIVRTRRYEAEDSQGITTAQVEIDKQGNGKISFSTVTTGMVYDQGAISYVMGEDLETQKKWLNRMTSISSFDTETISFTEDKNNGPTATVNATITARRLANVSGNRMFLNPNLFSQVDHSYTPIEDRKSDIRLSETSLMIDTVNISLPEGYYPEVLPDPITIESPFGRYEATFSMGEHGLEYIRRREKFDGVFPAEQYNDFVDYMNQVKRADRTKVVLVNRT